MQKIIYRIQDFFALAKKLDGAYLQSISKKNSVLIVGAAVLSILMECIMLARLFYYYPTLHSLPSKIYFAFYVTLIAMSVCVLILQPRFAHNPEKLYRLHFAFTAGYLIWNALLNTYDFCGETNGSCLVFVIAIVFASILIHFRPFHMMALQMTISLLFFLANHTHINDEINASLAVCVAICANFLFYHREICGVRDRLAIQQKDNQLRGQRIEGAKKYLQQLENAQKQTAIYRHDLRHAILLIEQLVQQGDMEKLRTFVSSSQQKLDGLTPKYYCMHDTTNLIMGAFAHRARNSGVTLTVGMHLPKQLSLPDTEWCALLCNLLENAFHSAEKVEQGGEVSVQASVKQGKLLVRVQNNFIGQITLKDGIPCRDVPKENHGYGIQSILDTVERYHGLHRFGVEEDKFYAEVLLYLE